MAGWRYIAQHPTSGEFIDWEVPLSGVALTRRLSGPGELTGTIEPEYARLLNDDGSRTLDEWATQIWAEVDGRIRGGGILTGSKLNGPAWELTCEGHVRYPHGLPYLDNYRRVGVDPLDAAREVWRHVQAHPDGDLGLVVDDTTSGVRIGEQGDPYHLAWWEAPDCGDEFETLAKETPFEFVEDHQWASDTSDTIEHRLRIGQPRLGRRRTDIAFAEGENLAAPTQPERDGETFAQYMLGLGSGEGRARQRTPVLGSPDGRLRRVGVLERNDIGNVRRLRRLASREQRVRRHITRIPDVVVRDHPNAPLGSWELGDEVLIEARSGWANDAVWCRIVEDTITPENPELAVLKLIRADGV